MVKRKDLSFDTKKPPSFFPKKQTNKSTLDRQIYSGQYKLRRRVPRKTSYFDLVRVGNVPTDVLLDKV